MKVFRISSPDSEQVDIVAEMLRNGELCVIPTETVYGLAANALDESAVDGIFRAKNRPNDNPLTVHICDSEDIDKYAKNVPDSARVLADKFWSGALTMVLERSGSIPPKVSAGSPTVALRMPDNDVSRAIIRKSGVPIVATSANRSGSPSPTTLSHVLDDMQGRVSAVVDGGDLELGIESTVINMLTNPPKILRLGSIGVAELESVIGVVEFDEKSAPASAHKHYSIGKKSVLVSGELDKFREYTESFKGDFAVLCFDGEESFFSCPCVTLGDKSNPPEVGRRFFSALRELEKLDVSTVFMRYPEDDSPISLAVKSRLMKTAENNFVEL